MTNQIPHTVVYNNMTYAIVNSRFPRLIEPPVFGMQPSSSGTSLWRGFIGSYIVKNKKLILIDLILNTRDDYLPIKGQLPQLDDIYQIHKYSNLEIEMDATSNLLLGQNPIVSSIFAPLSFSIVKGLHFKKGHLAEVVDYSEQIKQLRFSIAWRRTILRIPFASQYNLIAKKIPLEKYGYDKDVRRNLSKNVV